MDCYHTVVLKKNNMQVNLVVSVWKLIDISEVASLIYCVCDLVMPVMAHAKVDFKESKGLLSFTVEQSL